MIICGLSGGVASGKNLICDILQRYNAVIFDADKEARNLVQDDPEVIKQIAGEFPKYVVNNLVNRAALADLIFSSKEYFSARISTLEKILHPKIRQSYAKFLEEAQENEEELVILNIPLLLESKSYKYDKLVAIICDADKRKKRYISRAQGINNKVKSESDLINRFELIRSRQISDEQRTINADFVIDNSASIFHTTKQVKKLVFSLLT